MMIALPAFAAAPTQNADARRVAAMGNDMPRKVDCINQYVLLYQGDVEHTRKSRDRLTPPDEKKSISLPIVSGTDIDTVLDTRSCIVSDELRAIHRPRTDVGHTRPIPIPSCFFSGFASSISFPILLLPVSPDASFNANSEVSRLAIDNGGLAEAVGEMALAVSWAAAPLVVDMFSSRFPELVCNRYLWGSDVGSLTRAAGRMIDWRVEHEPLANVDIGRPAPRPRYPPPAIRSPIMLIATAGCEQIFPEVDATTTGRQSIDGQDK
jgi:hypothetical protein